MKKYLFYTILLCCTSLPIFSSTTKQIQSKEYFRERKVNLAKLEANALTNTIKINKGDTIVELYTPPVGDQGSQGCCNAWAFGYGCGSILAYNIFQDMTWAKRSPAFLFNINSSNCINNFSYAEDIAYTMYTVGTCSYNLMPYDSFDCSTQPDSIQLVDAALNKISGYNHLNANTNVSEYKQILRDGYPIVLGTKYLNDLQRVCSDNSLHGRWDTLVDTDTIGTNGHTLCIVGYNDSLQALKALNSWGTNYGDSGFVWISYNLIRHTDVVHKTFVLEQGTTGFLPLIEGPNSLKVNQSAYYYLRNTPNPDTITWTMNNNATTSNYCSIIQGQGTDSILLQVMTAGSFPGVPIGHLYSNPRDLSFVKPYGTLSVTFTAGANSYTVNKTINRPSSSAALSPALMDVSHSYSLELWHTIYGLIRTQETQSLDEKIDTTSLPRGIYIVLYKKQDGEVVAQKKIMVNN